MQFARPARTLRLRPEQGRIRCLKERINGGGAFDRAEIVGCKFDCCRTDVFFEAMQLGRAWDWNYPWLLRQQPSQSDLTRRRLLPLCDLLKQIDQGVIRFSIRRRKPRDGVAKIGAIESRRFVDLACQETLSQRAKWNEADSKFFKGRQHFLLRFSEPKRVFALDSGDRLNCVCATDR